MFDISVFYCTYKGCHVVCFWAGFSACARLESRTAADRNSIDCWKRRGWILKKSRRPNNRERERERERGGGDKHHVTLSTYCTYGQWNGEFAWPGPNFLQKMRKDRVNRDVSKIFTLFRGRPFKPSLALAAYLSLWKFNSFFLHLPSEGGV